MGDKLDDIINSSTAALVGIVLICALVIPVGIDQINSLTGDYAQWNGLLEVVIVMCIVGLIVGIIRFFSSNSKR